MRADKNCILTVNGGSSSIKFALYKTDKSLTKLFSGKIENIGSEDCKLSFVNSETKQRSSISVKASNGNDAAKSLMEWLEKQAGFSEVTAIGHRIVHGMEHTEPELITNKLLNELKKISPYDPEHLPEELKLIESFGKRYPEIKQVACFDTSFHTSMPQVARLLPIPHRFMKAGIKRYGFHGLSYSFLMEELNNLAGKKTANGKVILAHLGNGASLAAVKDGKSIDTSMGFTPASGVTMSTRTGELDPGIAWYLMQFEKLTPKQFNHLVNHESGLLGISETSSDMRELLKLEGTDNRAAEAVELFCYQIKKCIGSFAAVLGGVDALVFSGGIGENMPEIRSRICDGLEFLGIKLDNKGNANNETIISAERSNTSVYVIPTNEELMIARLVSDLLK